VTVNTESVFLSVFLNVQPPQGFQDFFQGLAGLSAFLAKGKQHSSIFFSLRCRAVFVARGSPFPKLPFLSFADSFSLIICKVVKVLALLLFRNFFLLSLLGWAYVGYVPHFWVTMMMPPSLSFSRCTLLNYSCLFFPGKKRPVLSLWLPLLFIIFFRRTTLTVP